MSVNCSVTRGNTKEWIKLKQKFNMNNDLYFNWVQLIHSIPQKWKNIIKNNRISENFFLNHYLIKCNVLLILEKLNLKELNLIQLTRDFWKPTSQIYFQKYFNDCVLNWRYIYILSRIVTITHCNTHCNTHYIRYFQYYVLINVLYLNEQLFIFGISETSQCCFCNQNNETIERLF